MSDFKMNVASAQGCLIIKLIGSLDVSASTVLERGLVGVSAQKAKRVVFDMSGLSFVSSLAMGTMVAFRNGVVRAGGHVFLAGMSPMVLDSFRRSRLTELFEVRESVEQCPSPEERAGA
jgi:anti-sigma B factor antagonist